MGDWAEEEASFVTDEWWEHLKTWNQLDTPAGDFNHIYWEALEKLISAALRQAAADARAQAIEKSADLIQHQAEQKDAT